MIAFMDFEYNCGRARHRMLEEVIQYGLIICPVETEGTELLAEMKYVRPELVPKLDKYIKKLTGITQEQVDTEGIGPQEAFERLFKLLDEHQVEKIYIWGSDRKVLTEYFRTHAVGGFKRQRASFLKKLRDVSDEYSAVVAHQAISLGDMAYLCDYEPEVAHDALADARTLKEVTVRYETERLNQAKVEDYRLFVQDRQLYTRFKSVVGTLQRNGLQPHELEKWLQECLKGSKLPEYHAWSESWRRTPQAEE